MIGIWEINHGAIQFIKRWASSKRGPMFFKMGDEEQTDLILVLSLIQNK